MEKTIPENPCETCTRKNIGAGNCTDVRCRKWQLYIIAKWNARRAKVLKLETKTDPKPCDTCKKVDNPMDCTMKFCPDWRAWFIKTWDRQRMEIFKKLKTEEEKKNGN